MNYIIPCLITARTRSRTINKTTGETIKDKISKKKHFLPQKSPSNNKIQSGKTLTTQVYFFVNTKQMGLYIKKTR